MIRLRQLVANDQLLLVLLAVAIGALGADGVIAFRAIYGLVQHAALGSASPHSSASSAALVAAHAAVKAPPPTLDSDAGEDGTRPAGPHPAG